jgi:3-isopropylmalate dehydratase small subunit
MHTNNILIPEQFGFGQGSSTENAAFKLTNSELKYIIQKMHVGRIFCDSAKDFNYVNREFFLVKLHYYGTQGTVANCFRSYLTNRKQKN